MFLATLRSSFNLSRQNQSWVPLSEKQIVKLTFWGSLHQTSIAWGCNHSPQLELARSSIKTIMSLTVVRGHNLLASSINKSSKPGIRSWSRNPSDIGPVFGWDDYVTLLFQVGGLVSTPLKHINQIGSFPQIGVNIRKHLKPPASCFYSSEHKGSIKSSCFMSELNMLNLN